MSAARCLRGPARPSAPWEGGRLASIVFGAGGCDGVLSTAFPAPQISAAFAANEADAPFLPAAAQALWYTGDGFIVATAYAAALFLSATGLTALRLRLLPSWLAGVAFLVAIALLIPPIGWAALIFAFPLWVIIASVVLWRRLDRAAPPGATFRPWT